MAIIKQSESAWERLAIPVLCLLLLLPFLHFYTVLEKLAGNEEQNLEALARERLLLEAESFHNDLRPEIFIEKSLREMNRHFGLVPEAGKPAPYYPMGYDPKLIYDGFIDKALNYLKVNFNFSPSIFIAADCDLRNSYSHFSNGFLKGLTEKEKFVDSAILSITFLDCEVGNLLPDSLAINDLQFKYEKKYGNREFETNFSELFQKEVSFFATPVIQSDNCNKFFSSKFGNQRAYNYCLKLSRPVPNGPEGLHGLYYLIVFGNNVSPTKILETAVSKTSHHSKRIIIKAENVRPGFHRNQKGIYYLTNFSSSWLQSVNDFAISNPGSEERLKSFFKTHAIATFLDNDSLSSGISSYLPLVKFLGRMLFLLLLGFSAFTSLFPDQIRLSLNRKLRLPIALIVFIPIVLIFASIRLIDSASEQERQIRGQALINQRIRQLEELERTFQSRIYLQVQLQKLIQLPFLESLNPDLKIMTDELLKFGLDKLGNLGSFFNRDGLIRNFERNLLPVPTFRKNEIAGLFRVFSGLGFTNERSAPVRKLIKENYLLGSFADAYWNVFASAEILASENEFIHNFFSVSSLRKSIYQLLANKDKPDIPFGIYFHELNENRHSKHFLDFLNATINLKSNFSLENGSVELGVFNRSTYNLLPQQWPKNNQSTSMLRQIAEIAFSRRASGSNTEQTGDNMILTRWVFKEDSPLIFVARATIGLENTKKLSFEILAWLLFFYGLLATILISNGLSTYFLQPVKVLLESVNLIRSGNHNFRLALSSQDEFSELGTSFNRMNSGLLQRAKMQRFVSDKLLESFHHQSNQARKNNSLFEATVLCSDIREFTTISEKNPPEQVVGLLNEYLTRMEAAIRSCEGSIEKIVGDAIIATFSGKTPGENANLAVRAARAMREALSEFNHERKTAGLFEIENGIGLASGQLILGFAGQQERRRELVMLGKAFQLAEELEAVSKHGTASRIIIEENTAKLLGHDFKLQKLSIQGEVTDFLEILHD